MCGPSSDGGDLVTTETPISILVLTALRCGLVTHAGVRAEDLCHPVAAAGGLYVSHMRGGYEANSAEGIVEMTAIAQ